MSRTQWLATVLLLMAGIPSAPATAQQSAEPQSAAESEPLDLLSELKPFLEILPLDELRQFLVLDDLKIKKLEPEMLQESYCQVSYVCMDSGGSFPCYDYYVEHYSEGTCDQCVEEAAALCESTADCSSSECSQNATSTCCKDDPAVGPCADTPYCESAMLAPLLLEITYRDYTSRVTVREQRLLYEYRAMGLESGMEFVVGRTDRERAFDVFRQHAGKHGGIQPGTFERRVRPANLYRCYVRVQSAYQGALYDQEVRGEGYLNLLATLQALGGANDLKEYLTGIGRQNVRIMLGPRCQTLMNSSANAQREDAICRYEGRTPDGTKIITTRYGSTSSAACAAAQAAAIALGDRYGGTFGGSSKTVFPSPAPGGGGAGCQDCGSAAKHSEPAAAADAATASPDAAAADSSP